MKYYEITVKTTHENSELIADLMYEVTNDGVSIVDREDLNASAWDYVEEGFIESFPSDVLVKGYCAVDALDVTVTTLNNRIIQMKTLGEPKIEAKLLDDDVWKDEWKKNYFAIPIGKVIICPVWLDDGNPKNVLIDTGLAFGTGQHETTSLCVELMQTKELIGKSVLDVGCGSGILGLCAAKLGAKSVALVDNDSQAAETTEQNISLNKLNADFQVFCGNLTDCVSGQFDFVFANLTAPILLELAKSIEKVVKKGTILILSGILNTYCKQVEAAYSSYKLVKKLEKGEWSALCLEV